jgi:hypothetical protein
MARLPRLGCPGEVHHVTTGGHGKSSIYWVRRGDGDQRRFDGDLRGSGPRRGRSRMCQPGRGG